MYCAPCCMLQGVLPDVVSELKSNVELAIKTGHCVLGDDLDVGTDIYFVEILSLDSIRQAFDKQTCTILVEATVRDTREEAGMKCELLLHMMEFLLWLDGYTAHVHRTAALVRIVDIAKRCLPAPQ